VLGPSTVDAQAPLTFEQALTMSRERALRVAVARARIDESKLSPPIRYVADFTRAMAIEASD